jgi:hypothetical protein
MLDVHPAHHAASTWRDFFIHIATIALGLLLAIALEQTVEAVHHHREREELIAAMRAEAQSNQPVFERTISLQIALLSRGLGIVEALTQATPHNGMVDVALPTYQAIPPFTNPDRATWTIARTNGKAALLPDNLAETYNRLDFEADRYQEASAALSAPAHTLQANTIRLGIGTSFNHVTRLHLSVTDRDALVQALAQGSAARIAAISRMAIWQGANNAVADGVQSREAMEPYMDRSQDALIQAEAKPLALIAPSNSPTSHAAQEPKQ